MSDTARTIARPKATRPSIANHIYGTLVAGLWLNSITIDLTTPTPDVHHTFSITRVIEPKGRPVRFYLASWVLVALLLGPLASWANAQSDNASQPAYSSGWTSGSNGGSGFGAWTLINGPANSGFFIGNSNNNGSMGGPGINTGTGVAWGMYANTGSFAFATRPFLSNLMVGDVFRVSMDNGFINSGAIVGFGLTDTSGQSRFNFQFQGGASNYQIIDAGGVITTTLPFTDGGLDATLTMTGANNYSLSVTRLADNSTYSTTGVLGGTANAAVGGFIAFNINAGSGSSNDAYFNKLGITPVPEPTGILAMCGIAGAAYGTWRRRRAAKV